MTMKKKWKAKFPEFVNMLGCQFCQDFFLYGDNIDELTYAFISNAGIRDARKALLESDQFMSLVKAGEIDPDKFLEEIRAEIIPHYEHLSALEYLEKIQEGLESNFKKFYPKEPPCPKYKLKKM